MCNVLTSVLFTLKYVLDMYHTSSFTFAHTYTHSTHSNTVSRVHRTYMYILSTFKHNVTCISHIHVHTQHIQTQCHVYIAHTCTHSAHSNTMSRVHRSTLQYVDVLDDRLRLICHTKIQCTVYFRLSLRTLVVTWFTLYS